MFCNLYSFIIFCQFIFSFSQMCTLAFEMTMVSCKCVSTSLQSNRFFIPEWKHNSGQGDCEHCDEFDCPDWAADLLLFWKWNYPAGIVANDFSCFRYSSVNSWRKILFQASRVSLELYQIDWYEYSPRIGMILKTIMARSQTPMPMVGLKMVYCSLQNYTSVMMRLNVDISDKNWVNMQ